MAHNAASQQLRALGNKDLGDRAYFTNACENTMLALLAGESMPTPPYQLLVAPLRAEIPELAEQAAADIPRQPVIEENPDVTRTKKPVKAAAVAKKSAQQKAQERLANKAKQQDVVRDAIKAQEELDKEPSRVSEINHTGRKELEAEAEERANGRYSQPVPLSSGPEPGDTTENDERVMAEVREMVAEAEVDPLAPVAAAWLRTNGGLAGSWGGAVTAGLKGKYLKWCRHQHEDEATALVCGAELVKAL